MFTILVVVGTMTFANYDNPATGCGDSSLKPPHVTLMVVQEEKSGDHIIKISRIHPLLDHIKKEWPKINAS